MTQAISAPPARFSDYLKEMKESGAVLAWIWNELVSAESKKQLRRMGIATLIATLFFSVQPLFFAKVINHVHDKYLAMLLTCIGGLALSISLRRVSQCMQSLFREKVWNRTMYSMQVRINELFCEKSLGQYSEEGSTLNYSTIDRGKGRIERIQEMLLFEAGGMIVQIMFSYAFIWFIACWMGLLATALVVVQVSWSLYLNYHISRETETIEQDFRAHSRQVTERWEKITRVKTSGKTSNEHNRLFAWFENILARDLRFWCWYIIQTNIRDSVGDIVRVVVIGCAAYLAYRGVWQVGMLVPVYTWMTDLSSNLSWVGVAERRINQQVPYIRAMQNALMITPSFHEMKGELMYNKEPIRVRFENVSLAYTDDSISHPILHDISFAIQPGEKVALIGSSGAGKTSIMKLLLRYMDPTSGEIWVNGSKLTAVQLASWMEHVGYIPQQPQVFDGTIRYNLTFGLSEERQQSITDDEIWEVMRLLQIDFGKRLTHGLDTLVGKDGMKLSGGQAQRLMIGAAVIKRPIFMVIDEATSSLDSSTERLVQQGLERVLAGPTGALIVAHRLSTVRSICNRFMVLRPIDEVLHGSTQIEAQAHSFEELYKCSPTFRRLANDQHIII